MNNGETRHRGFKLSYVSYVESLIAVLATVFDIK